MVRNRQVQAEISQAEVGPESVVEALTGLVFDDGQVATIINLGFNGDALAVDTNIDVDNALDPHELMADRTDRGASRSELVTSAAPGYDRSWHTGAMRPIEELLDVDDPAWPTLATWLEAADNAVALPVAGPSGHECLYCLQVTARSYLGAMALHTAGIVVDHGWLRLLGGSGSDLIDLVTANLEELDGTEPSGFMVVALDVFGGRFALNAGGLPGQSGEVNYWSPDSLTWIPLEVGYSDFIQWALTGGTTEFYADLRWDGWVAEVHAVGLDDGLAVDPPLSTAESHPIESTSRTPVPWHQLSAHLEDLANPPGVPVTFRTKD